jgi:hypothetical protein
VLGLGILLVTVLRQPSAASADDSDDPDRLEKMYWQEFQSGGPHGSGRLYAPQNDEVEG